MSQFKLVQNDVLERSFEITAPDHSVIKVEGMQFQYFDADEFREMLQGWEQEDYATIILGWQELTDGGGNELEYSTEALEMLTGVTWFRNALMQKYTAAINGLDLKNLPKLPVPGSGNPAGSTLKVKGKKRGQKNKQ